MAYVTQPEVCMTSRLIRLSGSGLIYQHQKKIPGKLWVAQPWAERLIIIIIITIIIIIIIIIIIVIIIIIIIILFKM